MPLSPRRHGLFLLALLPLMAATARPGWYSIHARLGPIDDEGYVMASVRSFMDGHALYDEVFSHYGPFSFLFKWLILTVTGLPVDHDTTRLVTLCIWVAAAAGCGFLVLRHTRSVVFGLAGYVLSFLYLSALLAEPGHPQEQGVLLVIATLVGASLSPRGRTGPWLTGAFLAAAALVKINVGVFLGLGLASALASGFSRTRAGRSLSMALALAALALPPALLLRDLGADWGRHYALAVGAGVLGAWGVLWARPGEPLPGSALRRLVLAAALTVAATVAFVLARGTTPGGLVDGFLLRPLAFSDAVFSQGAVPVGALASPLLSLLLAATLLPRLRRTDEPSPRLLALSAGLRMALGLAVLSILIVLGRGPAPLLFHVTPFAWLALLPTTAARDEDRTGSFGLRALVLTATLHALVAYPIYGSQRVWATFLFVPLGLIALHGGLAALLPADLRARAETSRGALLGGVLLVYATFFTWHRITDTSYPTWAHHYPLELAGADNLRVPFVEAGAARWVTTNLQAHGDAFYSLPGLNAFSFFTQQPPVTHLNVNYWMVLLTDEEQRQIIDDLSDVDRLCILVNPIIRSHWERHGRRPGPFPLVEHIEQGYVPRLARSGFQIHTRPGGPPLEEYLVYGQHGFDGEQLWPLPLDILSEFRLGTLTGWLRTESPGVVLGAQTAPPRHHELASRAAYLWVGEDGRLHATLTPDGGGTPAHSEARVDDGRWHHWALVADRDAVRLYLDGQQAAVGSPPPGLPGLSHAQLGLGLAPGTSDWSGFSGDLADVSLLPEVATPEAIAERHGQGRTQRP